MGANPFIHYFIFTLKANGVDHSERAPLQSTNSRSPNVNKLINKYANICIPRMCKKAWVLMDG